MRPAQLLLNAAKKTQGSKVPIELAPLFAAMGVALCSGTFFTYKKLTYDDSLRLKSNPDLSGLEDVLKEDKQ
ncbi:Mra1p RNJ42_04950 [Nakaseomyces bracarensis]|uniref:Mra1p n=1 Tax=Nakaseomyces bracarensis TaxID=273131 RepID=UPI0038716699